MPFLPPQEPQYELAGEEAADSKDVTKLRMALVRHFPQFPADEIILEGARVLLIFFPRIDSQ